MISLSNILYHEVYHGLTVLGYLPDPSQTRWLSLTAAWCTDSAQPMTQQHQSHLPRCLQACFSIWQRVLQIEVILQRALQQPYSWWSSLGPVQSSCNLNRWATVLPHWAYNHQVLFWLRFKFHVCAPTFSVGQWPVFGYSSLCNSCYLNSTEQKNQILNNQSLAITNCLPGPGRPFFFRLDTYSTGPLHSNYNVVIDCLYSTRNLQKHQQWRLSFKNNPDMNLLWNLISRFM